VTDATMAAFVNTLRIFRAAFSRKDISDSTKDGEEAEEVNNSEDKKIYVFFY